MLTLTDFMTVAGATAITAAVLSLLQDIWKKAPEPWCTWILAEVVVFLGGLMQGGVTVRAALVWFVSGIVAAATVRQSCNK